MSGVTSAIELLSQGSEPPVTPVDIFAPCSLRDATMTSLADGIHPCGTMTSLAADMPSTGGDSLAFMHLEAPPAELCEDEMSDYRFNMGSESLTDLFGVQDLLHDFDHGLLSV